MHSAALLTVLAASSAMAAPILDKVVGDLSGVLAPVTGAVSQGVQDLSNLPVVGNEIRIVYTMAISGVEQSLSVLDSAANKALAATCGDKLVDDVFAAVPIDFSQLSPEGLGSFMYNNVVYPIVKEGEDAANCVSKSNGAGVVVDCVVPVVKGLAFEGYTDLKGIESCLVSKLPVQNIPILGDILKNL